MDRGTWWAPVHGVRKSWTRMSNYTFTFSPHRHFGNQTLQKASYSFRGDHRRVIWSSLICLPCPVIWLTETTHPSQAPEESLSWVILQQKVLVRNRELTRHHQLEEFGKAQKDIIPNVLPTFQNPPRWNPSWLSNARTTRKDPESEWWARDNLETNPTTIKLRGWTILLGSLTLLLSAQASLANTVSCFVSSIVSSENSSSSVRQEPIARP